MGRKSPEEQMQKLNDLCYQKGGICLDQEYKGTKSYHRLKCKDGHEWQAKYANILSGFWCKECHYKKLSIIKKKPATEQMQKLNDFCKLKGGECLDQEYKGVDHKYSFKCKEGHTWKSSFDHVAGKRGTWCAVCDGQKVDPVSF